VLFARFGESSESDQSKVGGVKANSSILPTRRKNRCPVLTIIRKPRRQNWEHPGMQKYG